jgi:asparagine synthase (glutamine-hydrolysing)
MCGIWAYFCKQNINGSEMTKKVTGFRSLVKKIRHRGPDWSGSFQAPEPNQIYIAHERLAINGVESGSQPIHNTELGLVLSVNGEIYNHVVNDAEMKSLGYQYLTKSDCECIMYLYDDAMKSYETAKETQPTVELDKYMKQFLNKIDGIFAFVIYDYKRNRVVVSRDPIGVNSLYYGFNSNDDIYISSEMKALEGITYVKIFLPGQVLWIDMDDGFNSLVQNWTQYYEPKWKTLIELPMAEPESESETTTLVRNSLVDAVHRQLMTEVPFGVLLSGGLDSSLIASIAQKMVTEGQAREWGDKIHTFSIGLEDSPDMKAAAKVAQHIGSIHHGFVFTLQEAEDALEDVIYHLETYDITTIRASTPMFLLARRIKAMGIKMVLSGEGADEILGGYLYFHHAPTAEEFQKESTALIGRLHYSDCLRANKSTMAWGLEVRVPFLDLSFLETAMPISPELKMAPRNKGERRIEKYVLRKAFSPEMSGYEYLPEELLWRQKEQFSDGVGYGWIDHLKKITSERVSDMEVEGSGMNKEAYYYMQIYKRLFPNRQGIIPRWKPRTDWLGITSDDPSGRAVKVHEKAL